MNGLVTTSTGKSQPVTVPVRTLSSKEKQKRAFKALGFCWLGVIITAPLPPLHWVSVPGLFIAGIVMFIRRLKEKEHTEPFTFKCPECGGEVKVGDKPYDTEWEQVCPSCRFSLKVTLQEPAQTA